MMCPNLGYIQQSTLDSLAELMPEVQIEVCQDSETVQSITLGVNEMIVVHVHKSLPGA